MPRMFDLLIHADWSISAPKRWFASAACGEGGWLVQAPSLVGDSAGFLDKAFSAASERRVLAGFDFPIGVPSTYGVKTCFRDFREMLAALWNEGWSDFSDVAKLPAEISLTRPFYPMSSTKGVSRAELVVGLGVSSFDELLRICERRTEHRQAACSLFWTLGGNQVGKAALTGWQEIIRPALLRGAALWPFDGELAELANAPGLVLAETYPTEAYHMVGANFAPGAESKRNQSNRRSKAPPILDWARKNRITFSPDAQAALVDGFGPSKRGEDPFDAILGLLGMIEVVEGRQPERTEAHAITATWEGWILGR